MLFNSDSIKKILQGRKNQTRRPHTLTFKEGHIYQVRMRYSPTIYAHIQITKRYQQSLGAITEEEVHKEGFNTLEEFKEAWTEIYLTWNPEQIITAYEFQVIP